MVTYSFKRRFVDSIRVGLGIVPIEPKIVDDTSTPNGYRIVDAVAPKRQTIRAPRKGRGRHAYPGEELQFYCEMRTKHCFLIGRATCAEVKPISLQPENDLILIAGDHKISGGLALDEFAQCDGFADWVDMREFWRVTHPDIAKFDGVLILWGPLT